MKDNYLQGTHLYILNVAVALGTFIQVLDTSIANVAIPYIAGNLSVSADQGTWVITSFAASNAVVLPLTGWLADYFGRVRLFCVSVFLFALTSFLCGFSTSLSMLVFFRVLQGAVAGSLIPLSQSLLMDNNPPEKRGGALGFWGMVVIVAPVLGPIVGGYLTEVYSWPWIFYINVPIGIFSGCVTWYYLKDKESKINKTPINWTGLILLTIGVACLQIMLDKGKDLDWFDSPTIVALAVITVVSLSYFAIWNIYQPNRIVDFSFFKNRNFAIGTVLITVGYLIYFAGTVTVPLWLQTEQNYTAYWAGVAVAPIGIAPIFLSTTIGKYLTRVDLRIFVLVCFIVFSFGFFYQANFTAQVDLQTIMFSRFIQGFAIPFFFLPIVQISMGEIPQERYASATGLFHFIRILVGSGFGTSLTIVLWTRLEIFHHAYLTESITSSNPNTLQIVEKLQNSLKLGTDVIHQILDMSVEQQAFVLATNDLSWLGAWAFLALIPLLFFCKRVKVGEKVQGAAH